MTTTSPVKAFLPLHHVYVHIIYYMCVGLHGQIGFIEAAIVRLVIAIDLGAILGYEPG